MKKVSLFICLLLCISLVSCTDEELFPEKCRAVTLNYGKDALRRDETLHYQGQKYVFDFRECLYVTDERNNYDESFLDCFISFNGRGFGYVTFYYADTFNNPLFIYSRPFGNLYFRKDYDPMKDTFLLLGTNEEFLLCDFVNAEDPLKNGEGMEYSGQVLLVSKTNSRISCEITLKEYEGQLYATTGRSNTYATPLSDEMKDILKDAGILD